MFKLNKWSYFYRKVVYKSLSICNKIRGSFALLTERLHPRKGQLHNGAIGPHYETKKK